MLTLLEALDELNSKSESELINKYTLFLFFIVAILQFFLLIILILLLNSVTFSVQHTMLPIWLSFSSHSVQIDYSRVIL